MDNWRELLKKHLEESAPQRSRTDQLLAESRGDEFGKRLDALIEQQRDEMCRMLRVIRTGEPDSDPNVNALAADMKALGVGKTQH